MTVESLDELAKASLAGHPEWLTVQGHIEQITQQGMAGVLPYDESLRRRLELFRADTSLVAEVAEACLENISSSALEHKDWFHDNADSIYIISGGFSDFILPVADKLGLRRDHVYANEFVYDADGDIIGFDETNLLSQPQGKVHLVASLNLGDSRVVMIGDGYTDYEVKVYGEADEFWAYVGVIDRPEVSSRADRVIEDFRNL